MTQALEEHEKIELQWGEALLASEVDMPLVRGLMSKIMDHALSKGISLDEYEVKVFEDRGDEHEQESELFHLFQREFFDVNTYNLASLILIYWSRSYTERIKGGDEAGRQEAALKGLNEDQIDELFAMLIQKGMIFHSSSNGQDILTGHWFDRLSEFPKVFKRILSSGLSSRALSHGEELIIRACRQGSLEITQMLIEAGASVKTKGYRGKTALMATATSSKCSEALMDVLLEAGAKINVQDSQGLTALHQAICNSYEDLNGKSISLLLKKGARCDLCSKSGLTNGF